LAKQTEKYCAAVVAKWENI